jgi:hypothetical protein
MSNIESRCRAAFVVRRSAFVILLVVASAGCRQSSSTVRGKVTYEGSAVDRGQITFMPASGHGTSRSGPIASGGFKIDGVPPGPKIVQIIGVKQIHFKTRAEMAEAAKRGPPAAPETADEVPANAVGNGQTVEIAAGAQEMNFDLKRPSVAVSH